MPTPPKVAVTLIRVLTNAATCELDRLVRWRQKITSLLYFFHPDDEEIAGRIAKAHE